MLLRPDPQPRNGHSARGAVRFVWHPHCGRLREVRHGLGDAREGAVVGVNEPIGPLDCEA